MHTVKGGMRCKRIKQVVSITFGCAFGVLLPLSNALPAITASSSPMEKMQVWNLKNADIRAVIQTVSMITGKNFIIDPRVQGNVTFISQNPMSVDELYNAFLSMLQVLNYTAVQTNGITKIVPSMDGPSSGGRLASRFRPGSGDELVVRIIQINNVSATQLIPVIRPLMPQWASVSAYAPSNSLILAGDAGNINRLVKMVRTMDSKNANDIVMMPLKNASATNVVAIINKLQQNDRLLGKTANISLVADNTSNSILLSGNLTNISQMRLLIKELDKKSKNGGSDTKVIFLNYLSAKKLAPVLTKIAEGSLKASAKISGSSATGGTTTASVSTNDSTVSIQAEPDTDNAIIIRAPHSIMMELTKIVRNLDRKPQQVLVEAIIVKVDENLLKQLGIVWGTVNTTDGNSTIVNPNNPYSPTNNISQTITSPANTFALKIGSHGVGFIGNGSLQALIHALKSNGSTDILSTPTIVVLNGQKASISDGKNVGITNRQYQSSNVVGSGDQNLGTPFNTIQRQDVTLSLTVTPQISPNNNLRLAITQKDDSLEQQSTIDQEQDNPVIDTSQVKTNVLVHSGDILVLGGLIDHGTKQTVSKVPILGNIPLLGHLFTYTNNNLEKKDLMVFLKPVILSNRTISRSQTLKRYKYVRRQQLLARQNKPLTAELMPVLPPSYKASHAHLPYLPMPRPERLPGKKCCRYKSLLPPPEQYVK